MSDARHHHASRDVAVVFVEVPVGGSPKEANRQPPPRYPRNSRQPWRPRTKPPNRKAEGLRRLFGEFERQDRIVREMMKPDAAMLKAWMSGSLSSLEGIALMPNVKVADSTEAAS
jgi:hypothetical protein